MTDRLQSSRRAFVLGLAAAPWAARSATMEGQTFPDAITLANVPLRLNGLGIRAVAWLKGYIAALYMTQPASSEQAVVAVPGPKRISLRMLQEASTVEFVKAIDKGFARNTAAELQAALDARRQRWNEAVLGIGKVKPGDTVNLDYVPGAGMTMTYNGAPRGAAIDGEDFYAAVLRVFVGQRPPDQRLKAGMLGLPAP